jgi:hypothetical protein
MTEFLFPDNTVLCNFAAANRLDLLKSVLGGRGRWTEAIAYEAKRSARYLPALAGLHKSGWLGKQIEITTELDVQNIEQLRRTVFGGTPEEPLKHLGEAQTCYVIRAWEEFAGSWWISDDRESLRYARRQGLITRETLDLVKIAVANDDMRAVDAFKMMTHMVNRGRRLRCPRTVADLRR